MTPTVRIRDRQGRCLQIPAQDVVDHMLAADHRRWTDMWRHLRAEGTNEAVAKLVACDTMVMTTPELVRSLVAPPPPVPGA